MIVGCPACPTRYRFDEGRIPPKGLRARCTRCGTVFQMERPDPSGGPDSRRAEIERLARVVVSDLESYHAPRLRESIRQGRFEEVFHSDLVEARRLVKGRFPGAEDRAVEIFEEALEEICGRLRGEVPVQG